MVGNPHFASVVLQLHCDGNVQDSSPAARPVTGHHAIGFVQSGALFGKSLSLNGSNQYASVRHNPSLSLAGQDSYTVDVAIRTSQSNRVQCILTKRSSANEYALVINEENKIQFVAWDAAGRLLINIVSTTAVSLNTWCRVRIGLNHGICYLFLNGVKESEATFDGEIEGTTTDFYVGRDPTRGDRYFAGLLDELRLTEGVCITTDDYSLDSERFPDIGVTTLAGNATTSAGGAVDLVRIFEWPDGELVATEQPSINGDWGSARLPGVYGITYIATGCQPVTQGPYFVEAGADPHIASVVALLHFDGTVGDSTVIDELGNSWVVQGTVSISATARFGQSLRFSGEPYNYLRSDNTDYEIGANDFTIELFLFRDGSASGWATAFAVRTTDSSTFSSDPSGVYIPADTREIAIRVGGSTHNVGITDQLPLREWTHLALTRSKGVVRYFVAGVQVGEAVEVAGFIDGNKILLGTDGFGANGTFPGYIDELRFTNGVARYTESFTPPVYPFVGA